MKRFVVAAAAAISLAGAAAPAAGAATFEVGMEDECLILSNQFLAPAAVAAWKQFGVDVVRIHARWWEIAPAQSASKRPAGFNPATPNDPQYNWGPLDTAVAIVHNAGIKPMITITGPGPLWTSGTPSKKEPR